MKPELVVGVVFIIATLVAAGIAIWFANKRSPQIPWIAPIPGYYAGTGYVAPFGYDPNRITKALQYAETCLIKNTKWNAGQLAAAMFHAHVFVVNREEWSFINGQHTAGMQEGNTIQVGPSLAALCHEMAHLCEFQLDGKIDNDHLTWAFDGVNRAIQAYEEWRLVQGWDARLAS